MKIAKAYGIKTNTIENHDELSEKLDEVLATKGPVLCDVKLSESQKLKPKLIAIKNEQGNYISKPIKDMIPFLPRDEFPENMIIKPLNDEGVSKDSSEIN